MKTERLQRIKEIASDSIQFKFKYTNSNLKGGVKISSSQKSSLPYISGRTLLSHGITMPYDYNSRESYNATKIPENGGGMPHFYPFKKDIPPFTEDEQEDIRVYNELVNCDDTINCDTVQARQAQVLVKRRDSYVSLTPVSPIGMGVIVTNRYELLKEEKLEKLEQQVLTIKENKPEDMKEQLDRLKKETEKVKRMPHRIMFSIGGTNGLNVGVFAGTKKTNAYHIPTPNANRAIIIAYAYHFKGARIKLNHKTMIKFFDLMTLQNTTEFTNKRNRDLETNLVKSLVRGVLYNYQEVYKVLNENLEHLPEQKLVDDSVGDLFKGFILEEERSTSWKKEAATAIAKRISSYKYNKKSLALTQTSISFLEKTIEGLFYV